MLHCADAVHPLRIRLHVRSAKKQRSGARPAGTKPGALTAAATSVQMYKSGNLIRILLFSCPMMLCSAFNRTSVSRLQLPPRVLRCSSGRPRC